MVTTSERALAGVKDIILPNMPPTDYPIEDGIPLESDWHRIEISLLVGIVHAMWHGRTDYFTGGNLFLYYSTGSVQLAKKEEYRGPDFLVVTDVDGTKERDAWVTWEEDGRAPELIIELLSPSTRAVDLGNKKTIYERDVRVPEYVAYDRKGEQLYGWRLLNGRYQPLVPNEEGRLWLETIQVWVGVWHGTYQGPWRSWLRFWDRDGKLLPTPEEAEQLRTEAERQRAEMERQRAEAEQQRAEAERQRAEAEQHRAEAEHERAERLVALLRANGIDPDAAP